MEKGSRARRYPIRLSAEAPYLALELLRREVERREFARKRIVRNVGLGSIIEGLLEITGGLEAVGLPAQRETEEGQAVREHLREILAPFAGSRGGPPRSARR